METTIIDPVDTEFIQQPERPAFLKVLCILSFIACGLLILIYSIGTMCLALDADAVAGVWQKIVDSSPGLEDVDPMEFFHKVGMVCFYSLILNIVSLVGVILMWRLDKIGFFIYAIAELSSNFFKLDINMAQEKSSAGLIFSILIDVAFIIMYAVNLKYMNKRKKPVSVN